MSFWDYVGSGSVTLFVIYLWYCWAINRVEQEYERNRRR